MRPRRIVLFPYTTLFRSQAVGKSLAEQSPIQVRHVEGGQRRREERGPAAHELHLAPPVEQYFGHARGVPGAVVIEHDDPLRSEEHTSELQSHSELVCRLL